MDSPDSAQPLPPNPGFGTGAARRRIEVRGDSGTASGRLIDNFHEMRCWIAHDGEYLSAIDADLVRWPTTICGGAISVLQELVGMSIHAPLSEWFREGRARRHCTHLLDLAVHVILHAPRGNSARVWDVVVPDEAGHPVWIEVATDGRPTFRWQVSDGQILAPAEFAGLPLRRGFSRWAMARFSGDELEAAYVMAHAYLISVGRALDSDAWQGISLSRNPVLRNRCYAYDASRSHDAFYRAGNVRDFPDGIPRDWSGSGRD